MLRLGGILAISVAIVVSGCATPSKRLAPSFQAIRATGVGAAPRDLIECFFDEVSRHRFDPPAGGAAVVNVPVNLAHKESV
jgi:hypothetical protein